MIPMALPSAAWSDFRTSGRVEQRRAIADRSCDGVRDGHPAPPFARIRAYWSARTGWFEAEQPATRGGDTDRSSAVITIGHWNHARRDCGGRTAARAACTILEVPRIVSGTEEPGLRRGGQTELRGVGLAEDYEAGLFEAHDHFGVMIWNEFAKSAGAKGGDRAGI